ncbi:P22AR C-terminal domain-containing protein [Aeromonas veronii]|uniref:P22AR C-terminal domain-containing protein n=1 Tax=Aeromonas veronii TaxID=654 RepID=UPI001F1B6304|nr:P22AR C-terminal domain-containing protein [Aeromonas veronii]
MNRYPAGGVVLLTNDELHSLAWLWRAADYMMGAARRIYPLLEVAEHREAGTNYSIIHEYPMTLAAAQRILADKTHHIQPARHPQQPRLEQVDPPPAPPSDAKMLVNVTGHAPRCVTLNPQTGNMSHY